MPELHFVMTNLTCEACIKVSTRALKTLSGVEDVSIDLASGKAHIQSAEPLNPSDVQELLKAKGYTVAF